MAPPSPGNERHDLPPLQRSNCISVPPDRLWFPRPIYLLLLLSQPPIHMPPWYHASKMQWRKNCTLLKQTPPEIWCLSLQVYLLLAASGCTQWKQNLMGASIDVKLSWLHMALNENMGSIMKGHLLRWLKWLLFLSDTVVRHWPLWQLDVKNTFLHGDLQETVYMWPLLGCMSSKTCL